MRGRNCLILMAVVQILPGAGCKHAHVAPPAPKIVWQKQEIKDPVGKPFHIVVPNTFKLQPAGKGVWAGLIVYKNAAGDQLDFNSNNPRYLDRASYDAYIQMHLIGRNYSQRDLGAYTIYEAWEDYSKEHLPKGLHLPHVACTGLVIPHPGGTQGCQVELSSNDTLASAQAIVDGACSWMATHN